MLSFSVFLGRPRPRRLGWELLGSVAVSFAGTETASFAVVGLVYWISMVVILVSSATGVLGFGPLFLLLSPIFKIVEKIQKMGFFWDCWSESDEACD